MEFSIRIHKKLEKKVNITVLEYNSTFSFVLHEKLFSILIVA